MKRHYVSRWEYENKLVPDAACGQPAATINLIKGPKATYRKNHVTCGNCCRTKVFRGVR